MWEKANISCSQKASFQCQFLFVLNPLKTGELNVRSGRQASLYTFVPDTLGYVIRLCSWEITIGVQFLRLLSRSVTRIPQETQAKDHFSKSVSACSKWSLRILSCVHSLGNLFATLYISDGNGSGLHSHQHTRSLLYFHVEFPLTRVCVVIHRSRLE